MKPAWRDTLVLGAALVACALGPSFLSATTYYWGAATGSGNGTCNDGGPCEPIQDAGLWQRPIDAGTFVKNPTGCVPGSIKVATNDAGDENCGTNITIAADGTVTMPSGATIDGRDLSVDGTKLDGLPTSAVAQSSVYPVWDGGVNANSMAVFGYMKGTGGYTVNGDAGYMMPTGQCSIAIPNNQLCRFKIQWKGAIVPGIDAGTAPTGEMFVRRSYQVRSASNVLTITQALGEEADRCSPGAGTCSGGSASDGGVFQPWVQGNAATLIKWDCTVELLDCTSNP